LTGRVKATVDPEASRKHAADQAFSATGSGRTPARLALHWADRGEGDSETKALEPSVLLTTKLHVPALRHELIGRAPLVKILSAARSNKLTLVDAPAGWGKTTVLAQWVSQEQAHGRFAWLSLDRADNDPARFWAYVVAALQQANPEMATHAFEFLAVGADPLEVLLPTLLNDLTVLEDQIVLLLDDYYLVTNPAIHDEVAFVIDHMPPSLRLVLATRSDPPFPLARLRARGDLLEVRTHDLRFVDAEATVLLNEILRLNLAEEEVSLLCRRTEGWAAGLYLAALSLEGRPDAARFIRAFAGDNRHIVDYLTTEVLDGEPPELRDFLLRTSILERLSGPLCDEVLQTNGSGGILERIERENLFLVPLDSKRQWYRYHHLFGELLHHELQRSEPGLVPSLHRRAASWSRAEGSVDDSIHHLIAAGDVPVAVELIAAHWGAEFNLGRLSTVSGWLDLLPEQTVTEDPRLCLARTWIALDRGRLEEAAGWIEAAEAGLPTRRAESVTIEAEVTVLRAVQRFKIGDVDEAVDVARRAIHLDPGDSPLGRSAAYCIYGATLYWSGNTADAREALSRAVKLSDEADNHLGRTYALGYLAVIATEHGDLAEAERLVQQATCDNEDVGVSEHFVAMMPVLAMAKILDLKGEIVAAETAGQKAVALSRRGGGRLEVANALLTRAETLEHLGDRARARASVDEAAAALGGCRHPGVARQMLALRKRWTLDEGSRQRTKTAPGEELTNKELEVLRLLRTPMSLRDIGAHLYVSPNTVKTHQRALYRKLNVATRTEAIDRARELGLL
jgi:LuxR family maltose regulon positive regulatory protein